ncbi:MAG TPA: site-specific integrase [Rhodoblastus sp.]|nr:site-specific integrase [Rhodoblastus sp.]
MTLGQALRRYAREGLSARPANRRKDELRIEWLLRHPIAKRKLTSLSLPDLAAYRDFLIDRDYERRIRRAVSAADRTPHGNTRRDRLRSLLKLRAAARACEEGARANLVRRIHEIQAAEGIGPTARTTISNQVQLIRRAMKFAAQTTPNVPNIAGLSMPPSSPGRTRRPSARELAALVAAGSAAHPLLPLVIRFAVATGLRRERILEFRTSFIRELTAGKNAIVFPPSAGRRKRTGVVPVTSDIRDIITEGAAHLGVDASLPALARMDIRIFPINGNILGHAWRRLLASLAIEDLRFHDLRHEATSRLFESGLNAAEVMSITGHSTSEMVDRYSHYSSVLVLEKLELAQIAQPLPGDAESTERINFTATKNVNVASLLDDIGALMERLATLRRQLSTS